jgi:hypothetical protein
MDKWSQLVVRGTFMEAQSLARGVIYSEFDEGPLGCARVLLWIVIFEIGLSSPSGTVSRWVCVYV